ncbi:cupin domain-containing protein [Hyunsoonleella sp. SJ7]|uniref:Cupin domain-containing protein n=1 Tax=Hyunsoonleella aquatilis TaxID=2762758 RepID=A0A923H7U3_9FLAO|nr:cupin domain-containing protein [Hyunsoonleella aquatilis]MBC3757705.1 cupin domain-containing protein [Hyunsoonleella aquatilis]
MNRIIVLLLLWTVCACKTTKISEIKVEKLAETIKSWNGDTLPKYPEGQPKVTVLKITIPPKTKLHRHYHPVINSGIMLKGKLKVVDADENTLYLKEGDVIVELVNKIHYGINEGNRPVEIVVFYAGAEDLPLTVLAKDD